MSLKTWKKEFYPVEPKKRMTKKQAIEHSLRKWTGLLPSNLVKHGVYKMSKYIQGFENSTDDLRIDGNSCALCVKYIEAKDNCEACPLAKYLGHPCDMEEEYPYTLWLDSENPKPMIKALKKLLEES
jgi:hypothetical protein